MADCRFCRNMATHRLDALFNDIKSETGTADLASIGIIGTIKLLKDMSEVGRRNADAGVGDINNNMLIISRDVDENRAALTGIFNGVVDKIIHYLAEKIGVSRAVNHLLEPVLIWSKRSVSAKN